MPRETDEQFSARVRALTGFGLEQISDGVHEDLIGSSIVARRGDDVVLYVGNDPDADGPGDLSEYRLVRL